MSVSIYSNAFNFGSYLSGAVDPRTGQYSVAIPFVQIQPPNLDDLSRSIGITFSALRAENRGFGVGWSMSLCSLDLTNNQNVLTLSDGRTFRGNSVPPDGMDLTFSDQKLRDFRVTKIDANTFDVIYKDGVVERLIKSGGELIARLSLLRFPSGETFQFYHDYQVNGVRYLSKIVFAQTGETYLEITYQGFNARQVSYPVDHGKTARILLDYQNDLLTSVTLPYDAAQSVGNPTTLPKYTISYRLLLGAFQAIDRLRSPTGLVETLQYLEQGHRLNGGGYIPYVSSHEVSPGRNQPSTRKTYSFSQDQNFLGYASGMPQFRPGEDNLYLVSGSYTYKSTEYVLENQTSLSVTEREFNRFHLLTKEGKTQQGTRTTTEITYNEIAGQSFPQQPANLHLPRIVAKRYENVQPYSYRDERTETVTDEHGNTLSQLEASGVRASFTYYAKGGESGCPADPFGFVRYVKRAIVTPGAAGSSTANVTDYTYLETSTLGQVPARYFVNKATETFNGVMVKTFTYNNTPNGPTTHALLNRVETRWNNRTTVIAFGHVVSGGATQTTTTVTGFDGATARLSTTRSRITGRRWQEYDVNGVTTGSTYDVLGRVVAHTTSPGTPSAATRRYEYSFPGGDEVGRWPFLTEIDPQGVGKRVHFDGLGRVAFEEAQDDLSASSSPGAYRPVTERFYDVLGRTVLERRHDWLWNAGQTARTAIVSATRYEHDGWDRLRRTVFPDGHAELTIHDLVARTVRTGVEGEGNIVTRLDAFGNPLTSTQTHANGTVYATWSNQYDGFGRKISEQDPLNNTTRYSYDLFDRVTARILPENTQVLVQYADFSAHDLIVGFTVDGTSFGTRSYDGLGRLTAEGVGGRTSRYAYQGGTAKPHQVTTPKGTTLTMAYAPALGGRLVSVTGTGVSSQYQLDGRTTALTRAQSGDFIQELRYFASGLPRSSSEPAIPRLGRSSVATSYAYSMSGRIQTFVDGFNNAHTREYDTHGRLKTCQQGNRRASFGYDAKSRPTSIVVEDAVQRTSLTTSLAYDAFGRETLRVTSGSSSRRIETSYFANGQVSRRVTTEGGAVLRDETYVYDKRSRLQEYRCSGSQPPRDPRGRAVLAQVFTFDKWSNITRRQTTSADGVEDTTYHFSAQDPTQLSAIVQSGQTIALAYDTAGNLTRDERGQELQYDNQNRLIRVLNSNGQLLSEYHYDALGKLVAQSLPSGGHAMRYYQGEIINNQTLGDRTITYLGAEGQYFAQEEKQGATVRGQLFVTNREHSLVASVDAGSTEDVRYTPHGERSTSGEGRILIGFNGESVDPVTGWYFLGNGYRVFNPTLMRFHSPDSWSPFGQGGVNPYAYSAGDPINLSDPTGHLSWKAWLNIGLAVFGIVVGIVTLGAGAAVGAAAIAATTLGMASSAVSIAGAVLEENEKVSSILGWVSLGLGVASVGAGITAFARSTVSAVSAGSKAAQVVKNEVAGITESLVSKSLAISRGKAIAMGLEGIGHAADVVSRGTGIAAGFVENEKIANILNWVSVGTGNISSVVGGGSLVKSGMSQRSTGSPTLHSAPTGSRASSSDVALLAVRPLRDDAPLRMSSDRFNNAYNMLPVSPHGMFRNAEIEVESIFVTRL